MATFLSEQFKVQALNDVNKLYFANRLTALMLATNEGDLQFCLDLLKRGAKINARSAHNKTAIYFASLAGFEELVRMLICKGADLIPCSRGYTAFHVCATYPIMRHLYKKWPRNINDITNEAGLTPLHTATAADRHEIVRFLLENGANAAKRTKNGNNAFEMAAGNASHASLKILMGEYYVNDQLRTFYLKLARTSLKHKQTQFEELLAIAHPPDDEEDDGEENQSLLSIEESADNIALDTTTEIRQTHAEIQMREEMGIDFANEIEKGRVGRPRSITPSRRARVQAHLLDGMAVSDIARNLRMPPSTVRTIRRQMDNEIAGDAQQEM
ncbi:hypothetical protein niasHS_000406 [Heterodera schachtii]|uniref:Uncharacterized protein n=1 Tax=Heterodera schachtii TaxID=97005 RepID=A0ABD2KC38_HETSC